jgi:hypothetical protein
MPSERRVLRVGTPCGILAVHITRDGNLSQDELDQMKRNVGGLTLG